MAPACRCPRQRKWRVPRPRGDGPRDIVAPGKLRQGSPPTRGWPPSQPVVPAGFRGFPAHAGMALMARSGWRAPRGFPAHAGMAPFRRQPFPRQPGFPAYAGMALARASFSNRMSWFPRRRGNGPCAGIGCCITSRVSPPTRGWPARRRAPVLGFGGFPAHAGRIRQNLAWSRAGYRGPRTDHLQSS